MKSILDPSFHYTSSANTDLRKTFARVKRELRKQDAQPPAPPATDDAASNVSPMFNHLARSKKG